MSWAGIWITGTWNLLTYGRDPPWAIACTKFPLLSPSSPLAKAVANAPRRLLRCLCTVSALRSFLEESVRS
ncbi:hypothetical protein BKA70DRAFT_1281956 [Coprinopsis sp. MPI-PUGE-AT-0042]|nr:hypothetical protein BKA70DRAFT_1281956 [Coprinopsis sp. MPI-PUGE-AT-0042]